jgi:hypothetical protein
MPAISVQYGANAFVGKIVGSEALCLYQWPLVVYLLRAKKVAVLRFVQHRIGRVGYRIGDTSTETNGWKRNPPALSSSCE